MPFIEASNVLSHAASKLLSNHAEVSTMKTIGEIRRLRLKQFIKDTGMSNAQVNEKLGRNRRDATLSQISQAAKNTRTGKPREMGGTQARLIETTFNLPQGWFDRDPADYPDQLILEKDGTITVKMPDLVPFVSWTHSDPPRVEETRDQFRMNWPFQLVPEDEIRRMRAPSLEALERVMLAFLGSAGAPPDWRSTALKLAAGLDRDHSTDQFTNFVKAIQFELDRATPRKAAKKAPAAP